RRTTPSTRSCRRSSTASRRRLPFSPTCRLPCRSPSRESRSKGACCPRSDRGRFPGEIIEVLPQPPHPLGLHRSLEPPGSLPQLAWRLDPDPRIRSNEIAIAVRALNIDSASFHDLSERATATGESVPAQVARIVRERGKMHNPATNSGGICLGEIREIGPDHPAAGTFAPGDPVASLVSLTLTPLALEEIGPVVPGSERLAARGTAILFGRTLFARLPDDFPETWALAAFDVAGAPAQVRRHAQGVDSVLVVGTGK